MLFRRSECPHKAADNGIPFVCYNDYHISAEEFERRKNLGWPTELPGMLIASEVHDLESKRKPQNRNPPSRKRAPNNDDLFGPLSDA